MATKWYTTPIMKSKLKKLTRKEAPRLLESISLLKDQ